MSDTQRFGQSQTGSEGGGRSPEYGDNLTAQDQTSSAGHSPTGIDAPGSTRTGEYGDNTDGLGRDRTDQVTQDESNTLISADKVQGTAVYDGTGERLGTIDSLMLNKRSGKVAYAVMSFGGFLGIGERYHPLPIRVGITSASRRISCAVGRPIRATSSTPRATTVATALSTITTAARA
jgi:hypothetical protein